MVSSGVGNCVGFIIYNFYGFEEGRSTIIGFDLLQKSFLQKQLNVTSYLWNQRTFQNIVIEAKTQNT